MNSELAEMTPNAGTALAQRRTTTPRPVIKVEFSQEDLVRTRLGQSPVPLAETVYGLAQLRRQSPSPSN